MSAVKTPVTLTIRYNEGEGDITICNFAVREYCSVYPNRSLYSRFLGLWKGSAVPVGKSGIGHSETIDEKS